MASHDDRGHCGSAWQEPLPHTGACAPEFGICTQSPQHPPRAAPLGAGAGSGEGSSPTGTQSLLACHGTGRTLGFSVQPQLYLSILGGWILHRSGHRSQIVPGSFWVLPKLVFVSGEPFEGPPGGIPSTGPCPFHPAPGSLSSALLGCRKLCLSLHSTISIRDAHEGSRNIQSNISQIKKIESSSSGCGI